MHLQPQWDRSRTMRHFAGPLVALAAAATLTGCLATQSQLKHASDLQAEQLSQTNAALSSERAERAAMDSALRQELGAVRGDVQALRSELQTMRTEFGAKISMMEDGMHFAMPVNFDYDAAAVREQDRALLDRFARVAQQYYTGSRITVEGFADPAGSVRYNQLLSERRAAAVRSYLLTQGLTNNDLQAVGYGKTRLVAPGASRDQPG